MEGWWFMSSIVLTNEVLLGILDESRVNMGGCDNMPCACGRVNFNDGYQAQSKSEIELERLQRLAKNNPERFYEHKGSIHWVVFGGKEIVLGCPCGKDLELAKSLWEGRQMIAEFFAACTNKIRSDARAAILVSKGIKAAVEQVASHERGPVRGGKKDRIFGDTIE